MKSKDGAGMFTDRQANELFKLARHQLKEGEVESGLENIEHLLSVRSEPSPLRLKALLLKGRALQGIRGSEHEALSVAADCLAEGGPSDDAVRVLARAHLRFGPTAEAFRWFKVLHRRGDVTAGITMLGVLVSRGKTTAAERLAAQLTPGADGLLDYYRVYIALERGQIAVAETLLSKSKNVGTSARLRRLQEAVSNFGPSSLSTGSLDRHVGIAGVSYVGSTLLGVILGGSPGWCFVGETHWLTIARSSTTADRPSILNVPVRDWPTACRVCGRSCQTYTPEFRRELAQQKGDWYGRIGRHLRCRNIITSDKNLANFLEKEPTLEFDSVILFKSPASQVRSVLKQAVRQSGPDGLTETLTNLNVTLSRWADAYLQHLSSLRRGRRVVLDWERFTAEPARHLNALGAALDINIKGDPLEGIELGHFIGGNVGVDVQAVARGEPIVLRPSDAPLLPEGWAKIIDDHAFSAWVYRRLMREYKLVFS